MDIIVFIFHWYAAHAPEVHTTAVGLATFIWRRFSSAEDGQPGDGQAEEEVILLLFAAFIH